MPDHLLFLSHAGVDSDAALALAERIESSPTAREHGVRVWIDKRDLVAGQGWQRQLEQVIERESTAFLVYLGGGGVINWVEHEVRVALDRAARDASYPFIPVIGGGAAGIDALPAFARQYQGVLRVEDDPEALAGLVRGALGLAAREAVALEEQPFLGLQAFDQAHARLFFGREQETGELVARLREINLLMVVGDSGAGKSSLVKAGLGAAFRGGVLADTRLDRPDTTAWHLVKMRPGAHPFEALAEEVMGLAEQSGQGPKACSELADLVRAGRPGRERSGQPTKVRDALALSGPPGARLLLVVDQFEELWTLTEEQERVAFVEMLLTLVPPGDFERRVVLTMRRDYYNLCSELDGLYARLEAQDDEGRQRAKYAIQRMRNGSLRRCIVEPLALAGVTDAQLLADAVLQDVGDRPGDLALLEMALTEAWRRRGEYGGDLFKAYAGIGRVAGALAGAAEAVYRDRLTGREAEAVFVRLVRLGDTGGTIRRIGTRGEFSERQWQLVQELATEACSRLLVVRGESAELSHEALASQWPRYQRWLNNRGADRRADDKRRLDGLMDEAEAWASAEVERQGEFLLTGNPLDTGLALLDNPQRRTWLASREIALLEASRAHREALAERARREARRRQRLFRRSVALSGIASVAFVAAAYYGYEASEVNRALTSTNAELAEALETLTNKKAETERQRDLATERFAQAEAHAIWSNLVFADGKMTPTDLDALWRLAATREEGVRDAFLRQLLASESLSARFARAPEAITRALVGLDRARRDRMVETHLGPSATTSAATGPGVLGRALLAIELETLVQADVLIAAILKTGDWQQLLPLREELQARLSRITGSELWKVAHTLAMAVEGATSLNQRLALGSGLAATAGRLTEEENRRLGAALDEAAERTKHTLKLGLIGADIAWFIAKPKDQQAKRYTDALVAAIRQMRIPSYGSVEKKTAAHNTLATLGTGLVKLCERLDKNQADEAARLLVDAMRSDTEGENVRQLNRGLRALADKLSAERAGDIVLELIGALQESSWSEHDRLKIAIGTVAVRLTAIQAQVVVAALIDDIEHEEDARRLRTLASGLETMTGQLPGSILGPALHSLVWALQQTADPARLSALVAGMVPVEGQLTGTQVGAVVGVLVPAIRKATDRQAIEVLNGGLSVLATRLSPEQAGLVIEALVASLLRETDSRGLMDALNATLRSTVERLTPVQAGKAASALIAALPETTDWTQRKHMGETLQAVARRMDTAQRATVAGTLVTRIEETTHGLQLLGLTEGLTGVAAGLEDRPGDLLAEKITKTIGETRHTGQLAALVRGLAAIEGPLTDGQFQAVTSALDQTLPRETGASLDWSLVYLLSMVADECTGDQAGAFSNTLLRAVARTTQWDQHRELGKGLMTVAGKLPSHQVEPFANALAALIIDTKNSYLVAVLTEVADRLTAQQAGTIATKLLDTLLWATDGTERRVLCEGLAAVSGRLTKLSLARTADSLLAAIDKSTDPSELESLGRSLVALAGNVEAEQADPIAQALVGILEETVALDELEPFIEGLLSVTGKISPAQTTAVFDALLLAGERLKYSKVPSLGKGLVEIAGRLDNGELEPAADKLIDVIQQTHPIGSWSAFQEGLTAVAQRLTNSQVADLSQQVVTAIGQTTDQGEREALGECLVALSGRLTSVQSRSLAEDLIAALPRDGDSTDFLSVSAALTALTDRLTSAQADTVTRPILEAMQRTHDKKLLRALTEKLEAFARNRTDHDRYGALLWLILGFPNVTGEPQDLVLQAIRAEYPEAPDAQQGFWAMVEWADDRFPRPGLARPLVSIPPASSLTTGDR